MYCLAHFFGAYKNIYLDYDYLQTVNGHDELSVRFTRISPNGAIDIAETLAPACGTWKHQGFSEDELGRLKRFLADNMASLLADAEATRGEDEHTSEVTFELSDRELLMVLRASYLSGMSPAEFVNAAVRDHIERLEAQGDSRQCEDRGGAGLCETQQDTDQ